MYHYLVRDIRDILFFPHAHACPISNHAALIVLIYPYKRPNCRVLA